MTWAEFRLRLLAYNRMQENELYKLRKLAWVTYIAPHQDPKKLRGMTESKFMPIGKRQRVSKEGVEKFKALFAEYLKAKQRNGKS